MKGRSLNIKLWSLVKEMSGSVFHLDALKMASSNPSFSLSNTIHAAFLSDTQNIQPGFQISASEAVDVSVSLLSNSTPAPESSSQIKSGGIQWGTSRKEQKVGGITRLSLSIFAGDFHWTKRLTAAPRALTQTTACDRWSQPPTQPCTAHCRHHNPAVRRACCAQPWH